MPTLTATTWEIDEHTKAKHQILRKYLGAWFPIMARFNRRIVYIDGFSGPGIYKGGEPGSPIVALDVIREAGDRVDPKCEIVCLFTDESQDRLDSLKAEVAKVGMSSRVKPYVVLGTFEAQLQVTLDNLDSNHLRIAPTFAFIDPFGHKGAPYSVLSRFLQRERTEALINFNVQSASRFFDANLDNKQHLEAMLGRSFEFSQVTQRRRHEELRAAYKEQLEKIADYVFYFHVADSNGRPIYDLFFATKHKKGVEKIKDAFWAADTRYGISFSDATNPNQVVLLDESKYNAELLADSIYRRYAGKKVTGEEVADFVLLKTPYKAKHKTEALKLLKHQGKLEVSKDGKPYNNNFPPESLLSFT